MSNKITWMVGISCSAANGVTMERITGTEYQIKCYLRKKVNEDIDVDREGFDYGTTRLKDITKESDGTLQAYSVFSDYHIDYTAKPEPAAIILK